MHMTFHTGDSDISNRFGSYGAFKDPQSMQKSFHTKIRQNALSGINSMVSLYKGVERKADKRLAFFQSRQPYFAVFPMNQAPMII